MSRGLRYRRADLLLAWSMPRTTMAERSRGTLATASIIRPEMTEESR